jgi:hypothetical protein
MSLSHFVAGSFTRYPPVHQLLAACQEYGIVLLAEGDRIRCIDPHKKMPADLRQALIGQRGAVVEALRAAGLIRSIPGDRFGRGQPAPAPPLPAGHCPGCRRPLDAKRCCWGCNFYAELEAKGQLFIAV